MRQDLLEQMTAWGRDWNKRFPVRLTKKQKNAFLAELDQELQKRQFETERITVRKFLLNRLLVTQCETPKVIFLAHYDTPTIIPFWITGLFKLFGHTRQITAIVFLLVLLLILPAFFVSGSGLLTTIFILLELTIIISTFSLVIPNPSNAEDNTSGVIGLMALADWVSHRPTIQAQVQFVFLDNEELGLLGSTGLKEQWKKQGHPYADAMIINLDCVSRGEIPLAVYHKNDRKLQQLLPFLQKHIPQIKKIDMKIIPLSDNYTFRQEGAINISLANSSLLPGGYYIPKIHTPADKDFYPKNLLRLFDGLTEFLEHECAQLKSTTP